MRSMAFIMLSILLLILAETTSYADEEQCIGKCLTPSQFEQVKLALEELDSIHKSKATLTTEDQIVIIQDWQGRVYVNGGSTKPLKLKLKIGETIDRDLNFVLQPKLYYRPKPPDPMFRLRVRAQIGLLVPEMVMTAIGDKQSFLEGGLALDFFHVGLFNVSAYAGVRSIGGGLGIDLTKNFGPYVGYSFIYNELRSSCLTGVYFSFN